MMIYVSFAPPYADSATYNAFHGELSGVHSAGMLLSDKDTELVLEKN
jgi:hypothetical protein